MGEGGKGRDREGVRVNKTGRGRDRGVRRNKTGRGRDREEAVGKGREGKEKGG